MFLYLLTDNIRDGFSSDCLQVEPNQEKCFVRIKDSPYRIRAFHNKKIFPESDALRNNEESEI
jgi:hypothetical protein